jgi:hypothetical protein
MKAEREDVVKAEESRLFQARAKMSLGVIKCYTMLNYAIPRIAKLLHVSQRESLGAIW